MTIVARNINRDALLVYRSVLNWFRETYNFNSIQLDDSEEAEIALVLEFMIECNDILINMLHKNELILFYRYTEEINLVLSLDKKFLLDDGIEGGSYSNMLEYYHAIALNLRDNDPYENFHQQLRSQRKQAFYLALILLIPLGFWQYLSHLAKHQTDSIDDNSIIQSILKMRVEHEGKILLLLTMFIVFLSQQIVYLMKSTEELNAQAQNSTKIKQLLLGSDDYKHTATSSKMKEWLNVPRATLFGGKSLNTVIQDRFEAELAIPERSYF